MKDYQIAEIEALKQVMIAKQPKKQRVADFPHPAIIDTVRLVYVAINRYRVDINREMLKLSSDDGYLTVLRTTKNKVAAIEDCLKVVMDCLEWQSENMAKVPFNDSEELQSLISKRLPGRDIVADRTLDGGYDLHFDSWVITDEDLEVITQFGNITEVYTETDRLCIRIK